MGVRETPRLIVEGTRLTQLLIVFLCWSPPKVSLMRFVQHWDRETLGQAQRVLIVALCAGRLNSACGIGEIWLHFIEDRISPLLATAAPNSVGLAAVFEPNISL